MESVGEGVISVQPGQWRMPLRVYFRISLKGGGGQIVSAKIKGGSGASTNYAIIIE